jgi:hypothetical protein
MSVVLDANVVASLVIPLPYSDQAQRWMKHWQRVGVALAAPVLLEYELVTVLRKAVVVGMMTSREAAEALDAFLAVGVEIVAPTPVLHSGRLAGLINWARSWPMMPSTWRWRNTSGRSYGPRIAGSPTAPAGRRGVGALDRRAGGRMGVHSLDINGATCIMNDVTSQSVWPSHRSDSRNWGGF